MINQIKSNLRSKVFIFFLVIVLVYTSTIAINMLNRNIFSRKTLLERTRRNLVNQEEYLESERASRKMMAPNEKDMLIHKNYDNLKVWMISNIEEIIKIYEDEKISLDDAIEKEMDIKWQERMVTMYLYSDPEKGRPFFEDLYSEELEKYGDIVLPSKLPFDKVQLSKFDETREAVHFPSYSEKNSKASYSNIKMSFDRYFYNLENNIKEQDYKINAWDYLYNLNNDNFFVLAISFIMMVLSLYFIIDGKNTRSKQLFDTMPMKRNQSVYYYLLSSIVTILILLIISIGIPFLLIGFKNGFSGLKSGIFVFEKGFKSFNPYKHLNEGYNVWGYGKTMYVNKLENGYNYYIYYLPEFLKLIPFWKFLLLTGVLVLLKLISLSLLGTSIGLVFEKQSKSMVAIFFTLIFYIISQFGKIFGKYNPLAMASSWEMSLGYMPMTWFGGIFSLSIFSIIIFIITSYRLKTMDL